MIFPDNQEYVSLKKEISNENNVIYYINEQAVAKENYEVYLQPFQTGSFWGIQFLNQMNIQNLVQMSGEETY